MINVYIINLIDFFQKGGIVLIIIFFISLFLWYLLMQRYIFIKFYFEKYKNTILKEIDSTQYNKKFIPHIKEYFLSFLKLKLKKNLYTIQTLIIISPLVGLLGTVTGMIDIFETLSYSGSSDIKLMAGGISMATIPTMAGMVVSLSGILFKKRVDSMIKDRVHQLFLESSRIFT